MKLLKFMTCGSVDDGKSTLIGRLLYDSKSILVDQLEAIENSSKNKGDGALDLALLTDGLRAEREQGITIDVAYRYFSTNKRKFIIADAPGHIQYTRNMITGASNVDLAIVLIDARNGVVEQTKRHSIIASLLRIPHIVVAINKMDLVGYDQSTFKKIVEEYQQMAQELHFSQDLIFVPVSALNGDNIVEPSEQMTWYEGNSLLEILEKVNIDNDYQEEKNRFQVQWVIRPKSTELQDFRGYAGKVLSGSYKKGEAIKVLPSGITSEIERIEIGGVEIPEAVAQQSVTFLLKDDIDISRGDSIVKAKDTIQPTQEISSIICWLDDKPLQLHNTYILQHNTKKVRVKIKDIYNKMNVNTLEKEPKVQEIELNEIFEASLKTNAPLAVDAYTENRHNGAAILIDETSHNTVAAVMFQ